MIDDIELEDISDEELDAWVNSLKPENRAQIEAMIEDLIREDTLEIYP